MDKKFLLINMLLFVLAGCFIPLITLAQPEALTFRVDGGIKLQTIDGLGVNINAAWWYNGKYGDSKVVHPAIDLLIDSLGATIFRAVIEEMDWETVNDNQDAGNFNWTYFNSIFSNTRFKSVWNTLSYLNQRGIDDGLIISFMGGPPAANPLMPPDPKKSWMGNTNFSVSIDREDEFVESIAAFLYYARNTALIRFNKVSPMNETDIISGTKSDKHPNGIVEGPDMPDAVQFVRVIKKLALKLDDIGMSDIRFVAPDAAGDRLFSACLDEMVKDSYLMGKISHWGVHQYGNDADNYREIIEKPVNTNKSFWITETAGIMNLMGQLDDNASAHLFWDGFDCVYQHGIRNGYGSIPPNDWVFWEGESGKPLIAFNASDQSWTPRKPFYEFAQLFRFVRPGAVKIGSAESDSSLYLHAWVNQNGQLVIVGLNNSSNKIKIKGELNNLPAFKDLELFLTTPEVSFQKNKGLQVSDNIIVAEIPGNCIFTLAGFPENADIGLSHCKPEPDGWYAGDIHVHRNCGEVTPLFSESELTDMMEPNDLAVITLLADMGNGEVKDSKTDLPKVNGSDAVQSKYGRIVHWDAEWHFDPAGVTFENKTPGGHILFLGLKEAHTIWDESPYKILEWGRKQGAITGFCHMQYLNDSIQNELNCCIPIDFPVETALGTVDFLSEDVWLNDASVNAYYKILNCGFRPGWSAGTDFPCNSGKPLGSLLTYVQVQDQPLTYEKWIEGIKYGRTVVTTNGHIEFLDLKVNGTSAPGDEIRINKKGEVNVSVTWTSIIDQSGYIEIMCNGKVVARQEGDAKPDLPLTMNKNLSITRSSWICARRMDEKGHQSHTSPVYITIDNLPVRASAADACYFVRWIDNILTNIEEEGPWNQYFTKDIDAVKARYVKAREIYKKIAREAGRINKN